MEEEGIFEVDDDQPAGSYVTELNKLTGIPRPEDLILYAVPVCGPYLSLMKYKYKVKLTPGTQKKGKAGKQAMEVFTRAKDCTPREKDIMKFITDNECVIAILGDVKVSTPGMHALHAAKRSTKKAGKNKST